jgi:hypothetical protein
MRGQVTIFVIIAILIVISVVAVVLVSRDNSGLGVECLENRDCVPAECCHASSCVSVGDAPLCDEISCTLNCEQGTLDCGFGFCGCVDGRCVAEIN